MHATLGQKVKRNDTGAVVRVKDVRPIGLRVFYVTVDVRDGHTCILSDSQIRPLDERHGD